VIGRKKPAGNKISRTNVINLPGEMKKPRCSKWKKSFTLVQLTSGGPTRVRTRSEKPLTQSRQDGSQVQEGLTSPPRTGTKLTAMKTGHGGGGKKEKTKTKKPKRLEGTASKTEGKVRR